MSTIEYVIWGLILWTDIMLTFVLIMQWRRERRERKERRERRDGRK